MKFAIISAGESYRLAQEGVQLPKPLVQLNGMAMIDRLIHIFAKNGAEEVVVKALRTISAVTYASRSDMRW